MKILIPVKRGVDYNVKVRIKPDGSGVDVANVTHSTNLFDEIAVEEAPILLVADYGRVADLCTAVPGLTRSE